jgi:hypothetical protein
MADSMIPGKTYFVEVLVASRSGPDADLLPATGMNDVAVRYADAPGGDAILTIRRCHLHRSEPNEAQ